MLKKEKKGQERSEIVWWVIALIGLGVLGVFAYRFYAETPALLDKEACKESVAKRSLWGINILDDSLKPELRCKTQPIRITSTDTNVIKKDLSNAIYDCWDMLGQGKVDIFSYTSGPISEGPPNRCIICSTIQFNENVRKKVPRVDGLLSYMHKTKIPRKSITYYEFLYNKEASDTEFESDINIRSSISTKENYAVLFVASRDLANLADFFNVYGTQVGVGIGGGAATGAVIGLVGGPIGAAAGAVIGGSIAAIGSWVESLAEGTAGGCPGNVGCYALVLIPYNARELTACDSLESLP